MKRNFVTLAAVSAIALGGIVFAQAENGGSWSGSARWHGHGNPLARMTHSLNLTSDQQAKVQPILDQAKPQMVAIHQEAMQKAKAVMDNAMSQIRPLLTPEQQKKFDALQKARQDLHNAQKELHDAMKE
jgi:Spy/CpxP family protein refolding chaperone